MMTLSLLVGGGLFVLAFGMLSYWLAGILTDRRTIRVTAAAICAPALFLLAFADEIIAQYSINQVCAAKGASRIYNKMRVSDGFYTADGKPRWENLRDGDIDDLIGSLRDQLRINLSDTAKWTYADSLMPVTVTEHCIAEPIDQTILACELSMDVRHGWVRRLTHFNFLRIPTPACRNAQKLYQQKTLSQIFIYDPSTSATFVPRNSKKVAFESTVIPGERVGSVYLDMPESEITAMLGPPGATHNNGNQYVLDYLRVHVVFDAVTRRSVALVPGWTSYVLSGIRLAGNLTQQHFTSRLGPPDRIISYATEKDFRKLCYSDGLLLQVRSGDGRDHVDVMWVVPKDTCDLRR